MIVDNVEQWRKFLYAINAFRRRLHAKSSFRQSGSQAGSQAVRQAGSQAD
jgi:hypothetical protein